MIVRPKITSSVGQDISELVYTASINTYATCNVDAHYGDPGARMALAEEFLSRRSEFRAAVRAALTPNFTAGIADVPDSEAWTFSGYLNTMGASNAVGALSRPSGAVQADALVSHLRLSLYAVTQEMVQTRSEFLTGSLVKRLLSITDMLIEDGTKRLEESASPLAPGIQKAAEANTAPLARWRAILNASEDTVGYATLADLSGSTKVDVFLNSFLYNQMMASRADFFQCMLTLAGSFGLYYQPGIGDAPGRLCSPVKMLENPREMVLDGDMTAFSDGIVNSMVPTGILITGLPMTPSAELSEIKFSTLSLGDPAGVVWPEDAAGALVEVGTPPWLPTAYFPSDAPISVTAGGPVRFQYTAEQRQQELVDECQSLIKTLGPVINEFSQIAWLNAKTAGSSASFSIPLNTSVRAGEALKLTLIDGSITGIVSTVEHRASTGRGSAAASTKFSLSYLQD